MNAIRIVVAVALLFVVVLMLGCAAFYIYEMVEYRSRYRDNIHTAVSIVTWISHLLAGLIFLAAAILVPSWWRKSLAGWGMLTCLIMMLAPFMLSGRISFDEAGFFWIIAAAWLAFLSLALAVAAFLKPKAKTDPAALPVTQTSAATTATV